MLDGFVSSLRATILKHPLSEVEGLNMTWEYLETLFTEYSAPPCRVYNCIGQAQGVVMKLRGIWLDLAASAVGGLGIAIIWILGGILFQEDTMTDSVGVFIVFAVGFLFNLLLILPLRHRRGTWPPKQ